MVLAFALVGAAAGSEAVRATCERLYERVSRDEGQRGIGQLTRAEAVQGDLYNAAWTIVEGAAAASAAAASFEKYKEQQGLEEQAGDEDAHHSPADMVAILTGFPCLMQHTPPTETDGPLGAFAIARACAALQRSVCILTDEANEQVLVAAAAGCGISGRLLSLESFPAEHAFTESDQARLTEIASQSSNIVTVERPGPTKDGTPRTMRGLDMSNVCAPLHRMLLEPGSLQGGGEAVATAEGGGEGEVEGEESLEGEDEDTRGEGGSASGQQDRPRGRKRKLPRKRATTSIGIGDGGNEIGMGKIYEEVVNCASIPSSADIACTTRTDHLIVSSVSNWGAYALAAGMVAVAADRGVYPSLEAAAAAMLPSAEEEERMLARMVQAGARDGVTGENAMTVDGMAFQKSLDVLDDLRQILLAPAPVGTGSGPDLEGQEAS